MGSNGLMEGLAAFLALVIWGVIQLAYTEIRTRRSAKQTNQRVDAKVDSRVAEVKRETSVAATQTAQEWFADVGRKQLEAMERRNLEMEQRNRELEKAVNGFVDRMDEVERERDAFKQRLGDAEKALTDEKEAAAKRKEDYNQRITKLEEAHSSQVTNLESRVKQLETQNDGLTTRVQQLETENATLKQERDKAREDLNEVKFTLTKVEAENKALMLVLERINVIRVETKPEGDGEQKQDAA